VANQKLTAPKICMDNSNSSAEGVLVKATEVVPGDGGSVTTIVNGGACDKGERTIGGGTEI
jgi:hypothetical protein